MELSNSIENKIVTSSGEVKEFLYGWVIELEEDIRVFRREKSAIIGLPPYCVFPDTTLHSLIKVLPRKIDELWLVKGFNQVLIDTYGKEICELIDAYLKEKDIVEILYGKKAFDVSNSKVKAILGYLGVLEYFDSSK